MRNYHSKKRALVAGGAGFVGSQLTAVLLNRGYEVVCVDNLFTGTKENVKRFLADKDFEFIRHDIVNPLHVEVDEIYNLASPASPPHYQYDPVFTMKTNVLGTLNLLEMAKRLDAKFFQASTSEVYGDPLVHPQSEDYNGNVNPFGPRACYDEGKRAAETLCYDFMNRYDVDVRIARFFNTYGPGMHPKDGRVISNFILQALKGEPLTIYGDGSQTRSFCYVEDTIDATLAMMQKSKARVSGLGPVNIGNPTEFTVRSLAEMVIELTRSSSTIETLNATPDDPKQRKPDISKVRNYFNWEPKKDLRSGLIQTIKYFREILELES